MPRGVPLRATMALQNKTPGGQRMCSDGGEGGMGIQAEGQGSKRGEGEEDTKRGRGGVERKAKGRRNCPAQAELRRRGRHRKKRGEKETERGDTRAGTAAEEDAARQWPRRRGPATQHGFTAPLARRVPQVTCRAFPHAGAQRRALSARQHRLAVGYPSRWEAYALATPRR